MIDPGSPEHAAKLARVSTRLTDVLDEAFGEQVHWKDEIVVIGMIVGYIIGSVCDEDRENAAKEIMRIARCGTETLDEMRRDDDKIAKRVRH